jgi:glutaredoxin
MEIILYSTGCPRCRVLEAKLKQKGIVYVECNDVKEMEEKEISTVPCLNVDGKILEFSSAVKWVNNLEV